MYGTSVSDEARGALMMLKMGVARADLEQALRQSGASCDPTRILACVDSQEARAWLESDSKLGWPGQSFDRTKTPTTRALAAETRSLERVPIRRSSGTCIVCFAEGDVIDLNCPPRSLARVSSDAEAKEAPPVLIHKACEDSTDTNASLPPGCVTELCGGCFRTYVTGFVEGGYAGACKPTRCPEPDCGCIIPAPVGTAFAKPSASVSLTFTEHARSTLTLQCGACHTRRSLFREVAVASKDALREDESGKLALVPGSTSNAACYLAGLGTFVAPSGAFIPFKPVTLVMRLPLLQYLRGHISQAQCWNALQALIPQLRGEASTRPRRR